MTALDECDRIFMLGTKESEFKFNPVVRKLADGSFLVCMWTSQQGLDRWLQQRQTPPAYFETDLLKAFGAFVGSKAHLHILVDPAVEDEPYNQTFELESFPAERTINPHSTPEVLPILSRLWRASGLSEEKVEMIRTFAISHPELKAGEVINRFSEDVRLRANFMGKTGLELRAAGTLDQAKSFAHELLTKQNTPAPRLELYLAVWEAHPELSLEQNLKYASKVPGRTITELKESGDLELAWQFVRSELRSSGATDPNIERVRDIIAEHNDWTFPKAVEKLNNEINTTRSVAEMSGQDFEVLVADLFKKKGFYVDSTKASHDGGIDLIAHCDLPLHRGKYIIQCKRYEGSVGEPFVRDLYGVMVSEHANKGILVTNSVFTASAASFALGKPLELIDGRMLIELLTAT